MQGDSRMRSEDQRELTNLVGARIARQRVGRSVDAMGSGGHGDLQSVNRKVAGYCHYLSLGSTHTKPIPAAK